ncbi:MAG: glycosyltransferase family 39 protein, partial [Anaerolineae bacterium]
MMSAFQWREILQRDVGVGIILLLFCSLGLVWSITVPLFETPDEVWHYAYVKNIADGHGLPVQDPDDIEQPWRQEGSQPPLYYLTAALMTFWIDSTDFSELIWWNPFSEGARPGQVDDNQNLFIHTPQEGFPYRGAVLAIHIARLLSLAMGAVTVLATYIIASELFPHRREVAIGAATINAFNPQFTFISGSVSNDVMVTGISSLALLLMVRMVYREASSRRVAMLGVLVGLALLTKLSALALLPLSLVVLIVAAWRQGSWAPLFKWGVLFLALIGLLAGWWYVRNWLLYG